MKLKEYTTNDYHPGGHLLFRVVWYVVSALIFESAWFPFYRFKAMVLRLFGAQIGRRLVIKPQVRLKYPWHLECGDDVWIGQGVWIDNLTEVTIGNNVCLSQGVALITGNHDYKSPHFDLRLGAITIKDEVWCGAFSRITPGVTLQQGVVVSVGAVVSGVAEENSIYAGNPAVKVRQRYDGKSIRF